MDVLIDSPYPSTTQDKNLPSLKKRIMWGITKSKFELRKDGNEVSIDSGIVETVTALNLLGIKTSGSCEGHVDYGFHSPFIEIGANSHKSTSLVESLKHTTILQRILGKTPSNITSDSSESLLQSKTKLQELLNEFYLHHDAKYRLSISQLLPGVYCMDNGQEDRFAITEEMSEEEKKLLSMRVNLRQQEMNTFTEFLKNKYFIS